jgi:uncharacterized membrane protein YGL010W
MVHSDARTGTGVTSAIMRAFTERQMAMYRSFHQDPRNRMTHVVGVPAIVLAVLIATAAWNLPMASLTVADLLVAATLLLWLWMDVVLGIALGIPLVLATIGAHRLVETMPSLIWPTFLILFVGGWALQFFGHAAYERKRPAFFANLFQTLVAPLFLMDEALRAAGLRR